MTANRRTSGIAKRNQKRGPARRRQEMQDGSTVGRVRGEVGRKEGRREEEEEKKMRQTKIGLGSGQKQQNNNNNNHHYYNHHRANNRSTDEQQNRCRYLCINAVDLFKCFFFFCLEIFSLFSFFFFLFQLTELTFPLDSDTRAFIPGRSVVALLFVQSQDKARIEPGQSQDIDPAVSLCPLSILSIICNAMLYTLLCIKYYTSYSL